MNNTLNTHFARAIRKYGEDNFTIEIIDTANTQIELTAKESYWIRYYNSVECGYNETDAECKCGGNTYRSKTDDEMAIIKDKIRNTKMGGLNPNARKIKAIDITTGEETIFNSIIECARYLGIRGGKTSILKILNGKQTVPYKKKYYFEYCDEKSVSTIPDECMGVGLEISTSDVLGNEASENRSGRLS